MGKLNVRGVKDKSKLSENIKKVLLRSTKNLSWLKKGDTVLLKPALNSPDPYPSTTNPLTLKVVAETLREKGAKVFAADQSGIEYVLQDKSRKIKGSSKENYVRSGMVNSGVDFIGFEELGWEKYYKYKSKKTKSWKNGFYVSDLIDEVDHTINIPRLSTHMQSGVTLGFKNWVGIIRDDSRLEFHADGPYNTVMRFFARKSNLNKHYPKQYSFFKKMVEIYDAVKNKNRLTLVVGDKTQLTFGPDKTTAKFFNAHLHEPKPALVFASENPVLFESFSVAYLKTLYNKVSKTKKALNKINFKINKQASEISEQKVWENPFVKHALELGFGKKETNVIYKNVPSNLKIKLTKELSQ